MRHGAEGVRGGAAPSRTARPGAPPRSTDPGRGGGSLEYSYLKRILTYRNRGTYDPSMSPLTFTPPPGETIEDLGPGSYAAWEFYRDNTPDPWLTGRSWATAQSHEVS